MGPIAQQKGSGNDQFANGSGNTLFGIIRKPLEPYATDPFLSNFCGNKYTNFLMMCPFRPA
jgi:hypothetical protein